MLLKKSVDFEKPIYIPRTKFLYFRLYLKKKRRFHFRFIYLRLSCNEPTKTNIKLFPTNVILGSSINFHKFSGFIGGTQQLNTTDKHGLPQSMCSHLLHVLQRTYKIHLRTIYLGLSTVCLDMPMHKI